MTSEPNTTGEDSSDGGAQVDSSASEKPDVKDIRLPIVRAFSHFQDSMSAVFDLIAHQDQYKNDLDSAGDYFKKKVRQWNPVDGDDEIQSIFVAAEHAVMRNTDPDKIFKEVGEAAVAAIEQFSQNPTAYTALYYSDLVSAMTRRPRSNLMREALLTSAVSAFEALMGEIMLGYAQTKPESMFESDKKYKLCDVAKFSSIEDLVVEHAEQFVRDKLYESTADWFAWLDKCVGLSVSSICGSPSDFIEIFLRRNNIVHAGGLINHIYLSKLPDDITPPKLNSRLSVGVKYLSRSADHLLVGGYAAYAHFVSFYESRQASPVRIKGLIATNSYRLLVSERYQAVADYCARVRHLCEGDESARLVLMVNDWIARKALGRTDEVKAEVEAWDAESQPRRFTLARLALLDDHERAFALAHEMLSDGELQPQDWYQWPLLADTRHYAESLPGSYTPPIAEQRG